jgi:hypothetical protein
MNIRDKEGIEFLQWALPKTGLYLVGRMLQW